MLEARLHGDNSFVTLTYDDGSLRYSSSGLATLNLRDVQLWLKKLRAAIAPLKIRYFLAGEYGDESWRPHYHAALFGYPSCGRGQTGAGMVKPSWDKCCSQCELVGKTWALGNVYLGTLEAHSAQYICGYVTKKLTRNDDDRLLGRDPEFARMSLRPGIGADAMCDVASTLVSLDVHKSLGDVPVTLAHAGNRELPLGRYLRRQLRMQLGRDEKAPQEALDKMAEELLPVRKAAFDASKSFASALKEAGAGKVASFKARQRIFKAKRSV